MMAGVFLLGVVLLAGCGEQPRSDVQPMQFDVDPSRLGAAVEAADYGIRFQAPAGWEPLAASAIDSIGRAVALLGEVFDLRPRYVFLDPSSGSLLSVATISLPDSLPFDEQIAHYGVLLAEQFPSDTLRQGQYLKDGIHIAQFLVHPPGRVTFKLLFESPSGTLLQFDYLVPEAQYPGQIKAIESSIGSIQRHE